MKAIPGPRPTLLSQLLWLPIGVALLGFVYAVHISWHWPIVHDASIMHYVVFLMDHGMAPYRDIIDINMPGAYMTEWLVVHTFGPGDLAWRIFDILSMLVAIAACCVIASSDDWRAGLLSGICLSLSHLSDGAIEVGQRDWTMMVMLLIAYACLFLSMRRRRPVWMAFFGFACAAAASVKPLAVPIPFVLIVLACIPLRRERHNIWPYVGWAIAGAAAMAAIVIAFLVGNHTTAAFFDMTRGVLPFYTGIGNMPYTTMAQLALGRYLFLLLLIAIGLSVAMKGWRNPEQQMLFAGIIFGAALYFGQHKGWAYHRLTLMAFVLLWICIQCFAAVRRGGALRWLGGATLALLLLYVAGKWTLTTRADSFDERMQTALRHDLDVQGGAALSGSVQCIELGNGCITDLYRMRLVQSTGFLSDFFLFNQQPVPALDALRTRLMNSLATRPPRIIVIVASDWAGGAAVYQSLDNWPAFATWLHQHYRMIDERRAPDGSIERGSYRVYRLQ